MSDDSERYLWERRFRNFRKYILSLMNDWCSQCVQWWNNLWMGNRCNNTNLQVGNNVQVVDSVVRVVPKGSRYKYGHHISYIIPGTTTWYKSPSVCWKIFYFIFWSCRMLPSTVALLLCHFSTKPPQDFSHGFHLVVWTQLMCFFFF